VHALFNPGQTVRWGRIYRADGIHRIEGAALLV
jgi:hypothetical protein